MPTYNHDDPFRLRVQRAVCEAIKEVTPANGYRHDLGDFVDAHGRPARRVFRGRDNFGESDPLPMVSVLEDPRALDTSGAGDDESAVTKGDYRLLVQGFVKDDKDDPTDTGHRLAADVIMALSAARKNRDILGLGYKLPAVSRMRIGQPVVRPADNVTSSECFFFIAVTLTLAEDIEKPFL